MATAFGDRCIDQMPWPRLAAISAFLAPSRGAAIVRRKLGVGSFEGRLLGGHLAAWNARRPASVALLQQILLVVYREFDLFRPDGTSLLGVIHSPFQVDRRGRGVRVGSRTPRYRMRCASYIDHAASLHPVIPR